MSSTTTYYQPDFQRDAVQHDQSSTGEARPDSDHVLPGPDATFLDMVLPSFLRPAGNSSETVNPDEQTPQDLPDSPVLTEYVVGEAPVLPLADSGVTQTTEAQEASHQHPANVVSNPGACETVIPRGWSFNGNVTGEEGMTFACRFVGNIENTHPEAIVTMCEECQSEGSITASRIYLKGTHKGQVNGDAGLVVIEASARVTGDVSYNQIQIHGGTHNMRLQYAGADVDNVS